MIESLRIPARLMKLSELAALTTISRRTLERHIASGALRVVHLSRRCVRVMPGEARAWLERFEERGLR